MLANVLRVTREEVGTGGEAGGERGSVCVLSVVLIQYHARILLSYTAFTTDC